MMKVYVFSPADRNMSPSSSRPPLVRTCVFSLTRSALNAKPESVSARAASARAASGDLPHDFEGGLSPSFSLRTEMFAVRVFLLPPWALFLRFVLSCIFRCTVRFSHFLVPQVLKVSSRFPACFLLVNSTQNACLDIFGGKLAYSSIAACSAADF